MTRSHALLAGLFDYAGLFPPAALALEDVASRYAACRRGRDAWLLGRLVVPASQLEAFSRAADPHLPRGAGAVPWRISVLVGAGPAAEAAQVSAFNRRHADGRDGAAVVDTIELKATTLPDVRAARAWASRGFEVYCECAADQRLDPLLDDVACAGLHAKLRAGGTTPETFPPPAAVARFLAGCVARGISAKATAGLHHAVRGEYPLTYATGSASSTMYGYLNLVLAAGVAAGAGRAAVRSPEVLATIERVLSLTEAPRFVSPSVVEWRGPRGPIIEGPLESFALAGRALIRSIGSCSFEEPVNEARGLALLD